MLTAEALSRRERLGKRIRWTFAGTRGFGRLGAEAAENAEVRPTSPPENRRALTTIPGLALQRHGERHKRISPRLRASASGWPLLVITPLQKPPAGGAVEAIQRAVGEGDVPFIPAPGVDG